MIVGHHTCCDVFLGFFLASSYSLNSSCRSLKRCADSSLTGSISFCHQYSNIISYHVMSYRVISCHDVRHRHNTRSSSPSRRQRQSVAIGNWSNIFWHIWPIIRKKPSLPSSLARPNYLSWGRVGCRLFSVFQIDESYPHVSSVVVIVQLLGRCSEIALVHSFGAQP